VLDADDLIAHRLSTEEIAKHIGADKLFYQDLSDLYDAVKEGNSTLKNFEDSIFSGKYITKGVDKAYFSRLKNKRSESPCVT